MEYKTLKTYKDGSRILSLSDGNEITVNENNVISRCEYPERLQSYKNAGFCKTKFYRHLMGHTDFILDI